jgi:hypothetical protein
MLVWSPNAPAKVSKIILTSLLSYSVGAMKGTTSSAYREIMCLSEGTLNEVNKFLSIAT